MQHIYPSSFRPISQILPRFLEHRFFNATDPSQTAFPYKYQVSLDYVVLLQAIHRMQSNPSLSLNFLLRIEE